MSSVRNRIIQFQQNDSNAASCSVLKSVNGNINGNTLLSSSSSSALSNLKSSYARTRSVGSIPPDIVTTTMSNSGANRNQCNKSVEPALPNNINGNISISTSIQKPSSFPYGNSTQKSQQLSNNTGNGYFGSNYGIGVNTASGAPSLSPSSVTTSSAASSLANTRKYSEAFSDCSSSTTSLASSWRSGSAEKRSPAPEPNAVTIVKTLEIPLDKGGEFAPPPIVNRANKPGSLAMKKSSMSINLSGSSSSSPSPTGNSNKGIGMNLNGSIGSGGRELSSPTRHVAKTPPTPTLASPASSISSIPKLGSGNGSSGFGFGSSGAINNTGVRYRDPSPGGIGRSKRTPIVNRTSPAATPTGSNGNVAFGSTWNGGGSSSASTMGKFYQSIMWKEKFEESEKKKDHLVTLAQKATRDYEELRRRYHDLYTDHEKVVARFESATNQLESLRKASEATYEAYHKLKRKLNAENQEKSEALTRVDEYNRENRRLKRQSALMMQQIDPSTLLAHANLFDTVSEGDSAESDKEIQYLRQKVEELESKIVNLETELERIRLSEFESQESVLLMTDSIQSCNKENIQLKANLRKLEEENRKLARSLEDLSMDAESLKAKQSVEGEKLQVAEAELKNLITEKSILQRQSLVFMNNDEMDNRLLDALAQIEDLQRTVEDQKNGFETEIKVLKDRLSEKELVEETSEIQQSAKIKSLEEEIHSLRERAEEAERKLEDCSASSFSSTDDSSAIPIAPPPPPPPMGGPTVPPPPPPPLPSISLNNMGNGVGLGKSLQSAMTSLKKGPRTNLETTPNGSCDGQSKSMMNASPQIDDIVSQLKQGIKLRHIDRTLPRKQLVQEKSKDDNPVEELRSVLDNMRRSRTVDRRF